MERLLFLLPLLFLSGCALTASASRPASRPEAALPDMGAAPELAGDTWLNADAPLHLADLRGKVVLLEMWTFGCINCQHVIPSLKDWHSRYKDQGLVVIGSHFPEFDYEADLENLRQAVARRGHCLSRGPGQSG